MASLIPDKPRDRPTVPQVLPFVRAYYNDYNVGGSLHIALEDGNLEDSSIQFCIDYAEERGDAPGALLGRMLLAMTRTQRHKLYRSHGGGDDGHDRLVVRDGVLAIATLSDADYGPKERLGDLMYSSVRETLRRSAELLSRAMRGD